MDWREEYKRRLTPLEEAMRVIQPGHLVVVPIGGARVLPFVLFHYIQQVRQPIDLRLTSPVVDPGYLAHDWSHLFRIEFELFIGDHGRVAMDEGRAIYLPSLFSLNFKALDEGRPERREIDVAVVNVTPPDEEGFVTFGPHHWNKRAYARRAKRVIAEVDPALPRVHGDCKMHVSEIDIFVEVPPARITREMVMGWLSEVRDEAVRREYEAIVDEIPDPEALAIVGPSMARVPPYHVRRLLGLAEPPEDAKIIAGYVRELVPHGATIQIGFGDPSMYMVRAGAFDDKVDLGLHTEMTAPGVAKLVEAGVINGRRKNIHPGKAVAVAWSGSDFQDMGIIADNPAFELYDPEYLLDVRVLAQNDNFYSINNALSVDLTGQINSESVFGPRMINGTGGQPEIQLGALLSRGGRAITLLRSTALEGSVSRIVPMHEAGSLVTIPRFFADTVVTEYGIACLFGKNHRQRAEELIAVAHPDFRPELRRQAEKLFR